MRHVRDDIEVGGLGSANRHSHLLAYVRILPLVFRISDIKSNIHSFQEFVMAGLGAVTVSYNGKNNNAYLLSKKTF